MQAILAKARPLRVNDAVWKDEPRETNTVVHSKSVVVVLIALALSACVHPIKSASTTPQLTIFKKRGYICLRATKGSEYFSPSSVTLSQYNEAVPVTVWRRGRSPAEQAEVSAYGCVTAGEMSDNLLKPGIAYRASLKEEDENGKERNADFCVIGSPGAYRIRQVRPDRKTGVADWSSCDLKGTPPVSHNN